MQLTSGTLLSPSCNFNLALQELPSRKLIGRLREAADFLLDEMFLPVIPLASM